MATELPKSLVPQEPQGLALTEYLGVFQRRPGLIIVPTIIFVALAAAVAFMVPPKYQSFTQIKIKDPSLEKDLIGVSQSILQTKPRLVTIDRDVKNRRFYVPILQEIGLTEGYNARDTREYNELCDYVEGNLRVTTQINNVGADIVEFSYIGRDPQKAMDFLNRVRDKYVKEVFTGEIRQNVFKHYNAVRLDLEELKRRRSELQARLEAFRIDNDIHLIGDEREQRRYLLEIESQRNDLQQQIRGSEIELTSLRRQIREHRPQEEVITQVPNPDVVALQMARKAAERHLEDLYRKNYTDLVPDVQRAKDAIKQIDADILKLEPFVAGSKTLQPSSAYEGLQQRRLDLRSQQQVNQESLNRLIGQIEVLRNEIEKIPDLSRQLTDYDTKIRELDNQIRHLQVDYDRAERTWESVSGKDIDLVTVQYWPRSDGDPVFPKIPIFLMVGAGAGLLLGVGLAFLKEFAGMTFNTSAQVQSVLPLTVLGEVSRISTEGERKVEKRKKWRRWTVIGVLAVALIALHVFYLDARLSRYLPPTVIKAMDKVYRGR